MKHFDASQQKYPDVDYLPKKIVFVDGYRSDVFVFARSADPDVMVTNLPVDELPAELIAICSNVAEIALLGLVRTHGDSFEYAMVDNSVAKMKVLGREFADKMLKPLAEPEKTVIIQRLDMVEWFHPHRQYGWGRTIRNAPGTEYA